MKHALLCLMLLGLAWRTTRYALGFPIWDDEAFVAINFLERDFAGMLKPLIYGQIVPLGFMWANLAISRLLGVSEWALRLLPFAAGVVALPLFWRFASSVLKPRSAFLAVGVFSAAYYCVRHASEVKPYSVDLLVSLGLTMLAWSVFCRPRSIGRWIALIAMAGFGVWCSYPSVFVAGGAGLLLLTLVIRERYRAGLVAGLVVYGTVLSASFITMYLVYARPHAHAAAALAELRQWAETFPPLAEFWKLPIWFVVMHFGNMLAYPIGGAYGGSIVTFVLVVVGSVYLWRRDRPLLLLLLSPLALTFVAASLHKYPYGGSARTTQYMAPAFCLLTGLGLFIIMRRYLAGPRRAVALRLAGTVFALIAVVGIVRDVLNPFKSKPVHRSLAAVRKIAAETAPDDRWVVFNATERVPHAPYLGDWRGSGAQFVFNALRLHPGKLSWSPAPDTVRPKTGERVWLLAYRAAKVDFPEEQFRAYLDSLSRSFGPPVDHRNFFIREREGRIESLDAYKFLP